MFIKNTEFQKAFRNKHPNFSNLNRVACKVYDLRFANPMPEIEKLDAPLNQKRQTF